MVAHAHVAECVQAGPKVYPVYRVTRYVALPSGRSMTNCAYYESSRLHHSPWSSDIRTPNQLSNVLSLSVCHIQR